MDASSGSSLRDSNLIPNIWTSTFSFFLNSTVRFFVPVLLPFIISTLDISVYEGSLLVTAYWIGYTLFQIPGGYLSDKVGTARISKISFVLLSICFFFIPVVIRNYYLLALVQLLLGSVSSVVYVSGMSLVQRASSVSNRPLFIGIFQTGFFLGSSIGEYIVLRTFDLSFTWSFISISVLLISASVLNIIFQKEPKKLEAKKRIVPKGILYVSMIRFSAGFLYLGFLSLFTTFLVYDKISPFSLSYLYDWIPAVGGIIGSPLGGLLSRKMGTDKAIAAIVPIMGFSVLISVIALLPADWILAFSFLTGFFYGLYAGPSMGMIFHVSSEETLGASTGILNFSSQFGGIVSPLLIGALFSIYGNFRIPFLLIGLVSAVMVIPPLVIFIRIHSQQNRGIPV